MYGARPPSNQLGFAWLPFIQAASSLVSTAASSGLIRPKGAIAPSTAAAVMASIQAPPQGPVDWDDYLARYPDVANAWKAGGKFTQLVNQSGLHPGEFHYRTSGKGESRTLTYVTASGVPSPTIQPATSVARALSPNDVTIGGTTIPAVYVWSGFALAGVALFAFAGRR